MSSNVCQATRTELAEVTIATADARCPYVLCAAAAERLRTYSLRPGEWFNLAAVHGHGEFHLHDDFYTAMGKAFQAKGVDARLAPFPRKRDLLGSLDGVIDLAVAWDAQDLGHWGVDFGALLRRFPPREVANELQHRVGVSDESECAAYQLIEQLRDPAIRVC